MSENVYNIYDKKHYGEMNSESINLLVFDSEMRKSSSHLQLVPFQSPEKNLLHLAPNTCGAIYETKEVADTF